MVIKLFRYLSTGSKNSRDKHTWAKLKGKKIRIIFATLQGKASCEIWSQIKNFSLITCYPKTKKESPDLLQEFWRQRSHLQRRTEGKSSESHSKTHCCTEGFLKLFHIFILSSFYHQFIFIITRMLSIVSAGYQTACFTPWVTPFLRMCSQVFFQNVNVLETPVDVRMYFYSEKFLLLFGHYKECVSPTNILFVRYIKLVKFKKTH